MAKNRKFPECERTTTLLKCKAANSNTPANKAIAGDPVVIGQLPGVALTAADVDLKATVQLDGVFELLVGGIDGGGNSAVNGGDKIYFTAADTPPLNKKATGIFFGYAYGDDAVVQVVSGVLTTKIKVKVGY